MAPARGINPVAEAFHFPAAGGKRRGRYRCASGPAHNGGAYNRGSGCSTIAPSPRS
jgi:hypothetical protein